MSAHPGVGDTSPSDVADGGPNAHAIVGWLRLRLGDRSSTSHIRALAGIARDMGGDGDEFEVKLDRIGNRKPGKPSYLRRVRQAADKASGRSHRPSNFSGGRIGRGHAPKGRCWPGRGRVQRSAPCRDQGAHHAHQVGDPGAIRAHLRYVQRDGVTREGEPG